ncbi:MAG: hypothetical protein ACPL3C_10590 [Pyrobaculum sp.]
MKGARSAGRSGVVGSLGKGGPSRLRRRPRTPYRLPHPYPGGRLCVRKEALYEQVRAWGCWEHYGYYDQP